MKGRDFTLGVIFLLAGGMAFAIAPPFNRGQAHPHIAVPPYWQWNPEDPIDAVIGLEWVEVRGSQPSEGKWKGFYADGLLCANWDGPVHNEDFVYAQFPGNPGFDWWDNPGNPPDRSHVPPHRGHLCLWFAVWSQRPDQNPIRDVSVRVKVVIDHTAHGGGIEVHEYTVRIRIVGGPLKIEEHQRAHFKAFIKHPVTIKGDESEGSTQGKRKIDYAYPWYATDFDYNPFHYRSSPAYNIPGLQPVNVLQARPLWAQPEGITVKYGLTLPGTFLNPDEDLDINPSTGKRDPLHTWFLSSRRWVLISMNGDLDPTRDKVFIVGASYHLGAPPGPP